MGLAAELGVPPLVVEILRRRGLDSAEQARAFLDPEHYRPAPWTALPGAAGAVEKLRMCQSAEVRGSGDVDGQCAQALLVEGLRALGREVVHSLEERGERPRGENAALIEIGAGAAGGAELGTAPGNRLWIRPRSAPRAGHPFSALSCAGTAYQLLRGLSEGVAASTLDLAALGTLGAGAPLLGENRYLVQRGLPLLFAARRPGVAALWRASGAALPDWSDTALVVSVLIAPLQRAGRHRGVQWLLGQEVEALSRQVGAQGEDPPVRERPAPPAAAAEIRVELARLNLEMARQLRRLAPFGPGHPEPLLGAAPVRLVNATGLGLGGRHTRLLVEDEEGCRVEAIWWEKGPGEMPGERGEVVFRLGVDEYRGKSRVRLDIADFRPEQIAERPLPPLPFAVEDRRQDPGREQILEELEQGGAQVWAEGAEAARGSSRFALEPGPVLAIWTIPPGPQLMRQVLERVRPERVWLLTGRAPVETPRIFLPALAALLKGLAGREGVGRLGEVAARLGHREATVRAGLEHLAARGQIRYQEREGRLEVEMGGQATGRGGEQLVELLRETAAYRRFFERAPAEKILGWSE